MAGVQSTSSRLASLVRAQFGVAEQANRDDHERALDCLRQIDGTLFEAMEDEGEDAASVIMNITVPIVEQVVAMMMDVLAPVEAQPFTLTPSPVAELPPEVRDELNRAMEENLPQLMAMTGGRPDAIRGVVTELVRATTQAYQAEADEAAARLTTVISDRLDESGYGQAMDDFITNLVTYPTAILHGPQMKIARVRAWRNGQLAFVEQETSEVRNVSPFNVFPSPGARDLDTCEFVIERTRVTATELLDMANNPGVDPDVIDEILDAMDSYILPYNCGGSDKEPDIELADTGTQITEGQYDVLIFRGEIRGRDLEEYGVSVEDTRRWYESEVWVIQDFAFKAVLNSDPLGRRGYYTESYHRRPGEFWGKSAVELIRDAQRQCTAAGRALVRNMGFASGPIGEVETGAVLGDDDPTEIWPLMIRAVKPTVASGTSGDTRVYRFHTVPMLGNELMGIYGQFYERAFDLLGIPRLAFGTTQGQQTIGRTSGGIGMMLTQASKPIKRILSRVEKRVVEPLVQRYVDYELMYSEDLTVKGDVHVKAGGVSSLAEREQRDGRMEWALQSLAPFADIIPQEYIMRLLVAMMEQAGVPTKGLPDFRMSDAVNRDMQGQPGQQPAAQPGGTDATQFLDGRSGPAIDVINNMNAGGA